MGIIGRLKSYGITPRNGVEVPEAVIDMGGGNLVTAEFFADAGVEFVPLPGDYVALTRSNREGRYLILGLVDPARAHVLAPGERSIYARNPATGDTIAELQLLADGTLRGSNAAGYFELLPSGTFRANGATIPTSGDVITSDGISLRGHTHAQGSDSAGNSQVETNAPT